MHWPEIRVTYPDQWLIVEALEAHTTPDSHRHLDRLAVVEQCHDGSDAMFRPVTGANVLGGGTKLRVAEANVRGRRHKRADG